MDTTRQTFRRRGSRCRCPVRSLGEVSSTLLSTVASRCIETCIAFATFTRTTPGYDVTGATWSPSIRGACASLPQKSMCPLLEAVPRLNAEIWDERRCDCSERRFAAGPASARRAPSAMALPEVLSHLYSGFPEATPGGHTSLAQLTRSRAQPERDSRCQRPGREWCEERVDEGEGGGVVDAMLFPTRTRVADHIRTGWVRPGKGACAVLVLSYPSRGGGGGPRAPSPSRPLHDATPPLGRRSHRALPATRPFAQIPSCGLSLRGGAEPDRSLQLEPRCAALRRGGGHQATCV